MAHAYWQIGRLIIDDEQLGNTRYWVIENNFLQQNI